MNKTGWPAPALAQDDRKLFRWFASKPDARLGVREAAAEIKCACKGKCDPNRGRGQGKDCEASRIQTRRILGLNTSNSSVSQGAERVDTDEPPARFEDAAGWLWLVIWTLAVFVAVGLFSILVTFMDIPADVVFW